ncbi:hypothetical protein P5667_11530 [Bacillus velezensis]|uniref:hypothetical protein n=1 Tax=Bacillus velezensis TaxID=492670 RepID=UPI0027A8CBF6|nr:hypothetical protein [Bacillus velezensis]WEY79755.1 hypothetical protein P5667_11530 [Bacillus velezensis]
MKISYTTFMKHAEKVTKSAPDWRPVLKGVYHSEDGNLIVTDMHRLYFAKSAVPGKYPMVLDPKTGDQVDGTYPNIDHLIPDINNASAEITFETKELLSGMNALLKCNQVDKNKQAYVELNMNGGNIPTIFVENSLMSSRFKSGYSYGNEDVHLVFGTQYIIDALNLFKTCKIDKIKLRHYGSFRPFTITPDNSTNLLTLISPIKHG